MTAKTLILSGYGLNCERETAYCCKKAGGEHVEVAHLADLMQGAVSLEDYQFLIFIGGFLDGDDLGAGRVGANRFKLHKVEGSEKHLQEQLFDFISQDKLVFGICNGFQVIVKLGLVPALSSNGGVQEVSLTHNLGGKFEDRWVHLGGDAQSNCIFTQNIPRSYLPVRHGEGRVVLEKNILQKLQEEHLIPLQYTTAKGSPTENYPDNPNGSPGGIAALSNHKGNVMGMMPHPEAYNHYTNHPHWTRLSVAQEDGEGLRFFKNAYRALS